MTPAPFVDRHAYDPLCDCGACYATFHRNVRSRAGYPPNYPASYGYSDPPRMSWTPILNGLRIVGAVAAVVLAVCWRMGWL